jgi:hypothetical protein
VIKSNPVNSSKKKGKEEKKKMSESFQPINVPIYKKMSLEEIYETKEFLDPCGMEATDGIIDRLVGEQVDKIGSLLKRTLQHRHHHHHHHQGMYMVVRNQYHRVIYLLLVHHVRIFLCYDQHVGLISKIKVVPVKHF